ncbi:MAG: response regulator [Pseudomonadota bacterium]
MAHRQSAKSVLLVEDEDSIALALQFLIEREGHQVHRVADGVAAQAAIKEHRPDLVLLDIMMPGPSGYEICQEIRRDPTLQGVKILILTASGNPMARRKSLALGADGFLAKPFANEAVQGEVRRLLTERAA